MKKFYQWFYKKHGGIAEGAAREKLGGLAGLVGILANLLLALLKLVVGLLCASVAIVADALNNLSDAGSAIVTLVSFKMAAKPADRDHPFGHARIEYIASMVVSFLILLVGSELFLDSVKKIFTPADQTMGEIQTFTIVVLVLSIVGKFLLSAFYGSVGRELGSPTLKASSQDSLFDCISTAAVLICSIVIKFTGFYILDAIVGLGVSTLIFVAGIRILNETKNSLLGEAPVDETVSAIEEIVARYPEALGIHDMMIHNYGPSRFIASLHVEVDGAADMFELHDCIDNIERTVQNELNILCTIHMDPIVTDNEAVSSLREITAAAAHRVDERLSIHDFRTVIGQTHTNLIFDLVVPFEITRDPEEIRRALEEEILLHHPNHYCVITIDRA
ncbi:MAG: cation transporter [Clostridia bacterium]|nr:cation transporter [Clostridia bacterium]